MAPGTSVWAGLLVSSPLLCRQEYLNNWVVVFFSRHLWPPENETYPLAFHTEPFWGPHFWGFYPRNMSQEQLVCNEIGPHILLSLPVSMCSHHQALCRSSDTRVHVWIRTIIVPAKYQLISIVSFQLKLCITPHWTASGTVDEVLFYTIKFLTSLVTTNVCHFPNCRYIHYLFLKQACWEEAEIILLHSQMFSFMKRLQGLITDF